MMGRKFLFPNARIPFGTWGSSFFPAWQTSALAKVNIGQFAAEAMAAILSQRGVRVNALEYLVSGSTIPWLYKFWNSPFLSHVMGHRIPGFHIEQACATGLQAVMLAAAEIESQASNVAGVLTFDRTSNSPVGVFPQGRDHRRTEVMSDVWDNFGFDPATTQAMITAAGNAARKHGLDRREVDELAAHRYTQYFDTKNSGWLDRVLVPLDVLDVSGRPLGRIDDDLGIRQVELATLQTMPALSFCVTGGTQTHASDGMACLLVSSREKVAELSPRPNIDIQFVGKAEVRTGPALMPEAPTMAVQKLLRQTSLSLSDMVVVKSHNPFGVNDAIFSKVMGFDWHKMNNTGCSLVWGHPQGPTLTRIIIEALEEAVDLGGGYVLVFGCAAGDVGIAAILKVSEGGAE